MNAIRELVTVLRYQVDNSGLRKYQNAYRSVIGKIGAGARAVRDIGLGIVDGARLGFQDVMAERRALNSVQAQGNRQVEQMGRGYTSIASTVRGIVAGVSVISAARIADEWASVEGRIGLATDNLQDQKTALEEIYKVAQRTRQEYSASAGLFQRVQSNAKELGLGLGDSLNLTEVIGQTMSIGGGSAESQQAALMQLGQALGKGKIDGEELNSVLEQAPRLARAIADAFGVPIGKLKEMGKAGQLTSKELAHGLLKQAERINAEFQRMPKTFGGAMVVLKNAIGRQINNFNKATRASERFSAAVEWLADNLNDVVKVLAILGSSFAIVRLASMIGNATAAAGGLRTMLFGVSRAAWASLGPYAAIAAVLGVIYLIGEDIYGWLNGYDSVLGGVVGGVEEWGGKLNGITEPLRIIWEALGSIATSIGDLITGFANWVAEALGMDSVFENWQEVAIAVFGAILTYLGAVFNTLSSIISAVAAAFRGDWDAVWFHLQEAFRKWGEWLGSIGDVAAGVFRSIGEAIDRWITEKLEAGKRILANLAPEWLKSGASWVGKNVLGIGGADVQRAGATAAPMTVQNNVGGITVNAPSANPAAVAAATQQGVSRALGPRLGPSPLALPTVEAMP